MFGVLNAAATQSSLAGSSGQQYAFGYSYTSQRFSVVLQRIQRTGGFRDLSVYDLPLNVGYRLVRGSTQATSALNLGALGGDGSRTRIANASYTRPRLNRATLCASLNKTIGDRGVAAQMQLVVPLGGHGVVTTGATRDVGGNWTQRAQYSRGVPGGGGLGWNLAYAGGASHYQQSDMTWRNRYFQVQGGAYGYGSRHGGYTRWDEMQGSVVVMDGAVLPANRVDDAFVLIDTQGQPGIPVRYENQPVGTTDTRGPLLVPWSPSFYAAKYEIDPLGLPANMRVPTVERRVAVGQRGGAGLVPGRASRVGQHSARRRCGQACQGRIARRASRKRPDRAGRVERRDLLRRARRCQPPVRDETGRHPLHASFDADVNADTMSRVGRARVPRMTRGSTEWISSANGCAASS